MLNLSGYRRDVLSRSAASSSRELRTERDIIPPVAAQVQHVRAAQGDRRIRASVNHGRPAVAASARPGEAKQSRSPTRKGGGSAVQQCPQARNVVHPSIIFTHRTPSPAEHRKPQAGSEISAARGQVSWQTEPGARELERKQEQDHQKIARQNDEVKKQQVEQDHQQQTQQMERRHVQQQQLCRKDSSPEAGMKAGPGNGHRPRVQRRGPGNQLLRSPAAASN